MYNRINYNFFKRKTVIVAQELLGKELVLKNGKIILSGIIVETEAYHQNDPASHSYCGITNRNKVMFGPPGFAYVYFIYGMHYCFNVVTEPAGCGGAVLIRALEPIQGITYMEKHRQTKNFKNLTNGPAKLTQAFGITRKFNNVDLVKSSLGIYSRPLKKFKIIKAPRIGISKAHQELLRFYIQDNPFVSAK